MANYADIQTAAQEAISSAVAAVESSARTRAAIEKNIQVTDYKVNEHNNDVESHMDIRSQMASMFNTPTISGPSSVESGQSATWTLSVTPRYNNISCSYFVIGFADGSSEQVTATNNSATFTHTFIGVNGTSTYFTATASTSDGMVSRSVKQILTITAQAAPDVSGATISIPDRVTKNRTYTFQVNGIEDANNDLDTITISSNNANATFSSSSITQGTDYTFTVGDIDGPATITISVVATDLQSQSSTILKTITVNAVPDVTGFAHTLPNYLTPGVTSSFRVSGVVDPDASSAVVQTLSYSVASSLAGITFSKSSGILLSEEVTVYVSNELTAGTSYTLTFTFIDGDNGTATATVTSVLNTLPNASNLVSTLPTRVIPNQSGTFTISGATDSEGEAVTYSIVNISPYLTLGTTSGLHDNDTITYSVANSAPRGNTLNYTVRATDASGGYTDTVLSAAVNSLLSVQDLSSTLIQYYTPDSDHTFTFNTATDSDGDTLYYTVTSNTYGVTVTNGSNVAAGTTVTIHTPTTATVDRGNSWTLSIAVYDGYETETFNVNIVQTLVPTITDTGGSAVTTTVTNLTVEGGSENATTFTIAGPTTDVNGLPVTYNIVNNDATIHFSKTTGIAVNESVSMSVDKVSTTTSKSFGVTVSNNQGETSANSITISFEVDPIEVTAQPTITYPTALAVVPHYTGFTMTWSAITTAIDLDNSQAYPSDGSEV